MKGRRLYEIAAMLIVVAAFAGLYFYLAAIDPPENAQVAREMAILMAIPTVLWAVAVQQLVRRWWASIGARLSTMDPQGRLLAGAVAALPEHRRDWGAAMLAELPQVEGAWRRWRFAFSCVRVALLSPPAAGWPLTALVTVVAGFAVVAAGSVTRAAVPGLEVFAGAFVAFIGLLAVVRSIRSGGVRLRVPFPLILLAAVVAACIGVTMTFLLRHPDAAQSLPPSSAVFLAVVLGGALWLAFSPPRSLAGDQAGPHIGVGMAVVFAGVVALSVRNPEGLLIGLFMIWLGAPLFAAAGFLGALAGRSFRTGLHAAAWSIFGSILSLYAMWLPAALSFFEREGSLLLDGDSGSVGTNLGDAMFWGFMLIPILAIPFGVIGAAFGAWVVRKLKEIEAGPKPKPEPRGIQLS